MLLLSYDKHTLMGLFKNYVARRAGSCLALRTVPVGEEGLVYRYLRQLNRKSLKSENLFSKKDFLFILLLPYDYVINGDGNIRFLRYVIYGRPLFIV